MSAQMGIVNLCMLLGLCLLVFKLLWVWVFATVQAIMKVSGKYPSWPLSLTYAAWGYSLASLTTVTVLQAWQTVSGNSPGYKICALVILAIYMTADQMAAIWIAERKQNQQLRDMARKQHWVMGAFFVYAGLNLWAWPQWGHWTLTTGWVGLMQRLLAVPGVGILFGIIGILYVLRLLARVVKFVRIGPKGLPPYPKNLR